MKNGTLSAEIPSPIEETQRNLGAMNRGADVSEWNKDIIPENPGIYDVVTSPIPGATVKRVLYSESEWLTDKNVFSWKNSSATTNYASKIDTPTTLDSWTLEPLETDDDLEKRAVLELAKKELNKGIEIKIQRVFKVGDSANGVVSGKILATSENYAAQSIGNDGILLHSQNNLDRIVIPGEYVTFQYSNGKASVFDGCLFDITVKCDTLSDTQLLFLRKRLQDALSMFENKPTQDSTLVAAAIWAKNETIKNFSLETEHVHIKSLSVEDTFSSSKIIKDPPKTERRNTP